MNDPKGDDTQPGELDLETEIVIDRRRGRNRRGRARRNPRRVHGSAIRVLTKGQEDDD